MGDSSLSKPDGSAAYAFKRMLVSLKTLTAKDNNPLEKVMDCEPAVRVHRFTKAAHSISPIDEYYLNYRLLDERLAFKLLIELLCSCIFCDLISCTELSAILFEL